MGNTLPCGGAQGRLSSPNTMIVPTHSWFSGSRSNSPIIPSSYHSNQEGEGGLQHDKLDSKDVINQVGDSKVLGEY